LFFLKVTGTPFDLSLKVNQLNKKGNKYEKQESVGD